MNYFTTLLETSNRNVVEPKVFSIYVDKTSKDTPDNVKRLLYLMKKYGITDRESAEALNGASSSEQKKTKTRYGISDNDFESMVELMKQISKEGNARMLPQLQTKEEIDCIINGKKTLDDVTIDLETEKGRDAIAKKFMPLVYAIARKYEHKSSLSYEELISAGMMGLMQAMLEYHKPGDDEQKSMPFKKYAGSCIQFAICKDMDNSRTIRLPKSELIRRRERGESLTSTVSLDKKIGGDEDSITLVDLIADIMPDDESGKGNKESDEKMWDRITKFVDKSFGSRPASMFYKTLGINGFKRMKQNEIAKQMGCTPSNVNIAVKKIVNAINSNPEMKRTINTLMGYYTEALLIDNYKNGKDGIMEAFANDDIYLMLSDMTRWSNADVLESVLKDVLLNFSNNDAMFVTEALNNDFAWLDDRYNANKPVLVAFLEAMNPTETYKYKSDVNILNAFTEVADAYKSSNLSL